MRERDDELGDRRGHGSIYIGFHGGWGNRVRLWTGGEREGDGAIGFDLVRRKCDHRIKMNGPQNWIGRWPRWERKLASQDFV
jgi:hypothetical protein